MGANYVLLQDEYKNAVNRMIKPKPEKILITTGGTDFSNISVKCIRYLNGFKDKLHIDIIIGPGVKNKENIRKAALSSKHVVTIHEEVGSLYKYLLSADMVITTGGLTTYEVVATRAPSLMIIALEHQRPKPEFLAKKEAAINLGFHESLTEEIFIEKFSQLYDSHELRRTLSSNCQKLIDGHGVERISNHIVSFIHQK